MIIEYLPWDSELLGFGCWKINDCNDIDSALREIKKSDGKYVFVRLDSNDTEKVQEYEDNGFKLLDAIITLRAPVTNYYHLFDYTISEVTKDDIYDICELAEKSFVFDRFHNDPFISNETANKLHSEWVKNSVAGNAADIVYVAKYKKKDCDIPIGFITVKKNDDICKIPLVCVHESHRRIGVASGMIYKAFIWARENNAKYVDISTQLNNIPAINCYINMGFLPNKTYFSLRKIL